MTAVSGLKFFSTSTHACSYLQERQAVTLFADPKVLYDLTTYGDLTEIGFRRSGNYLYRPHCHDCNACIPVRIPVDHFSPNRRQRRVLANNQDIRVHTVAAELSPEHYALYERYICARHSDGDMYPPSIEQYMSFLTSQWSETLFHEFRVDGRLLGIAVTDALPWRGLSAVYTFFDPDEARRSLGAYAILWQIEEARRRAMPYLYLGYWIRECQKMNYKAEYRPLELYWNDMWVRTE